MFKLIKIESRKLLNYRTFWTLSILYFVLMGIVMYGMNKFKMSINSTGDSKTGGNGEFDFGTLGLFNFPDVWHVITYMAGFFFIIPSILIIITVCNEYEFRTFRQNVIDGLTRTEWLLSKVVSLFFITLASTIFVLSLILILGFTFSDLTTTEVVWQKSNLILIYFLQMSAYLSFAFMLANLLKRPAIAIAILLLYVYVIESIIGFKFDLDMPMQHIRSLISAPAGKIFNTSMTNDLTSTDLLLTVVYALGFIGVTAFVNQKRDI